MKVTTKFHNVVCLKEEGQSGGQGLVSEWSLGAMHWLR